MSELLRAIDRSIATGQTVEIEMAGSSFDFVSFFYAVESCTGGEICADGTVEAWGKDWFVRVIR